jgi:hypothetical protein
MKPPGTNAGSGSISRLGPQFADRRPRIPRPSNAPNVQNSNRESLRLETAVTSTKQTLLISSNREKEALFSTAKMRPHWGSRAGTPTSGVAGGLTPALPYDGTTAKSTSKREKTNSRPPTFVAIRKKYVIGSIRLKENFNLTM